MTTKALRTKVASGNVQVMSVPMLRFGSLMRIALAAAASGIVMASVSHAAAEEDSPVPLQVKAPTGSVATPEKVGKGTANAAAAEKVTKGAANTATVGKVGTGVVGATAPGKVVKGTANAAAAGEVGKRTAARGLAVGPVLAGKVTVEQAWQSGALTLDDVWHVLQNDVGDWGEVGGRKNDELRRALAGLLIKHGAQRLKNLAGVPAVIRLWVGDYYQNAGDARAAAVLESVLSEVKAPLQGESALVFQAMERLAWHHQAAGRLEEAARTWLRAQKLYADAGTWLPSTLFEAARLYTRIGDAKKAQQLYKSVHLYEQNHLSELALLDQAHNLAQQGRHEEILNLLNQIGRDFQKKQMKVILLQLVGTAFYKLGKFTEATKSYSEAIEFSKSLISPSPTTELAVGFSREGLQWIKQWEKVPFVHRPTELYIVVKRKKQKSTIQPMQRLVIQSFRSIPVIATIDDARLEVRTANRKAIADVNVEKEVIVEVMPGVAGPNFEATLTVMSPQRPHFKVTVPITVDIRDDD